MGYGPKGIVAMKVNSFEQSKREYRLVKPTGYCRRTLFYLAVGESTSEYRFDFLGSAIYDYLSDPLVASSDKLRLLGNLHCVVKADHSAHLWRVGSLVPEQDLYRDWCYPPKITCESSKDETRMVTKVCSECGGHLGYHFPECKEF